MVWVTRGMLLAGVLVLFGLLLVAREQRSFHEMDYSYFSHTRIV